MAEEKEEKGGKEEKAVLLPAAAEKADEAQLAAKAEAVGMAQVASRYAGPGPAHEERRGPSAAGPTITPQGTSLPAGVRSSRVSVGRPMLAAKKPAVQPHVRVRERPKKAVGVAEVVTVEADRAKVAEFSSGGPQ